MSAFQKEHTGAVRGVECALLILELDFTEEMSAIQNLNDRGQIRYSNTRLVPSICDYCTVLYIHSSVHRNSILIRSNKMQQYAGIYLLQNHSTCFGCPSHPSSGVHKTVTAASGTGHSI